MSAAGASTCIRYRAAAGVAWITMDGTGGNALNGPSVAALADALRAADADPSIRALVIEGERDSFCSGLDPATAAEGFDAAGSLRLFAWALLSICRSRLPVIARVEGKATGGGVGLAAACDIVLAGPDATFILPEVVLGMVPAVIAPFVLRRVPPGRLGYLTVSSRTMTAQDASRIGLVDEIDDYGARPALERQLARLGRSSPDAIAAGKRLFLDLAGDDLERQVAAACQFQLDRLERTDVRDALRQFADGLTPPWFERLGDART